MKMQVEEKHAQDVSSAVKSRDKPRSRVSVETTQLKELNRTNKKENVQFKLAGKDEGGMYTQDIISLVTSSQRGCSLLIELQS